MIGGSRRPDERRTRPVREADVVEVDDGELFVTAASGGGDGGDRRSGSRPRSSIAAIWHRLIARVGADHQFLIVLALVLLPIFVTIIDMNRNGWLPTGDDAFVARRTMQVASSKPPKLGQDSTAKAEADGRLLNHPGPLAYYLSVGPYAASGWHPVGLLVGVAIVLVGAVVSSVWLARRTWGPPGMWASAIALLLVMIRLSPNILVRPTSSLTVVLPVFAMLMGLGAFVVGTRAGAIVAVLMANYCLQTSLVVLPIVGVTLIGLLVVASYQLGRGLRPGRGAVITAGFVAATWIPPLQEELGPGRGNISGLVTYLLGGNTSAHSTMLGWDKASDAVAGYVVSMPWNHTLTGTSVRIPVGSFWGLVAVTFVFLGIAWRMRRHVSMVPVVVVASGAALSGMYAFSKRPHSLPRNPNFMSGWIQALAGLYWFVGLLLVFSAAPVVWRTIRAGSGFEMPTWVRANRSHVGLILLGVLTLSFVAQAPDDSSDLGIAYRSSRVIREFSRTVRSELDGVEVNVIGSGIANNQLAKGLGVDLRRRGFQPRFREMTPMSDERHMTPAKGAFGLRIADVDDPPERWDVHLATARASDDREVAMWLIRPQK